MEEHGAWVSASEIYEELRRVGDAVIRLEERLAHDDTRDEVQRLEGRVSALEQRVWLAAGFSSALGAVIGIAVPVLIK